MSVAKVEGHRPVRRRNAPAKRTSAKTIISRWLPNISLFVVGAVAVAVMSFIYPQLFNVILVSTMGGIFIASGLLGLVS